MRLVADNISFSYNHHLVLSYISAEFKEKSLISIVGPNGSGKTTLFKILSGSEKVMMGKVSIDGLNIRDLKIKDLAHKMSYVAQNSSIEFGFTVEDIVIMGRNPYIKAFGTETENDIEIARVVMQEAGITHIAHRMVNELSGGEYQRVMIARALAQKADIMLLDEPVSSLDIKHQEEIMRILRREADRGVTVICVLHDLNLAAAYSDQIIMLSEGRIYAQGTPHEALTEDNINAVYGLKVDVKGTKDSLYIVQRYVR